MFPPHDWTEVAIQVRILIFNDFCSSWPFLWNTRHYWDLLFLLSLSSTCQDFRSLSVWLALYCLLLWFGLDSGCCTDTTSTLLNDSLCQCSNLHLNFSWTSKHWVQMKSYAVVQSWNRKEQIWHHIGSVSFTLTFVFHCFCYKLRMLLIAWNIQDSPFSGSDL